MERSFHTDALLVRSVDYRESDRIVTLLTADEGRVGAMARGARRSKKRFGAALQPFQIIRASLTTRPRSDLALLTEAELVRAFPAVASSLEGFAVASMAAEVARELAAPGEADGRPFALLAAALDALDRGRSPPHVLAEVLLGLLAAAGVSPALDRCACCGRAAPAGAAALFDARRGIVCRACGGAAAKMRGRAREALLGASAGREAPGTGPEDLGDAVGLLLAFVREQTGRRLASETLLELVGTCRIA